LKKSINEIHNNIKAILSKTKIADKVTKSTASNSMYHPKMNFMPIKPPANNLNHQPLI
jgi:hypothetical protein